MSDEDEIRKCSRCGVGYPATSDFFYWLCRECHVKLDRSKPERKRLTPTEFRESLVHYGLIKDAAQEPKIMTHITHCPHCDKNVEINCDEYSTHIRYERELIAEFLFDLHHYEVGYIIEKWEARTK